MSNAKEAAAGNVLFLGTEIDSVDLTLHRLLFGTTTHHKPKPQEPGTEHQQRPRFRNGQKQLSLLCHADGRVVGARPWGRIVACGASSAQGRQEVVVAIARAIREIIENGLNVCEFEGNARQILSPEREQI